MRNISNDIKINRIRKGYFEDKINPNFIYNRMDLIKEEYDCLELLIDSEKYYIVISVENNEAIMGVWLMDIPQVAVRAAADYIFSNHKNVKVIKYMFGKNPIGLVRDTNHFRIELPNTCNELENRLSSKGRYNLKREKRILQETFGDFEVLEYGSEEIDDGIVNKFFELKKITHGREYEMSPQQYIKEYYVSNIYVLKVGEDIASIVLSCEQCNIVYLENITYDLNYQKYAVGKILYSIYLEKLIEKHKEGVFLAGGVSEYKKRYASIEENVFHCEIYRNKIIEKIHLFTRFVRERIISRL